MFLTFMRVGVRDGGEGTGCVGNESELEVRRAGGCGSVAGGDSQTTESQLQVGTWEPKRRSYWSRQADAERTPESNATHTPEDLEKTLKGYQLTSKD